MDFRFWRRQEDTTDRTGASNEAGDSKSIIPPGDRRRQSTFKYTVTGISRFSSAHGELVPICFFSFAIVASGLDVLPGPSFSSLSTRTAKCERQTRAPEGAMKPKHGEHGENNLNGRQEER
eukprot:754273-Hanusia_phi.AAC.4